MKKVFLGGTCNGSKWRERLIEALEGNKECELFNPVGCDPHEVEQQRKIVDKTLYCITPKSIESGKDAFFKEVMGAVEDATKNKENTVIVFLREDEDERFYSIWKAFMMICARLENENDVRCLQYLNIDNLISAIEEFLPLLLDFSIKVGDADRGRPCNWRKNGDV